MSPSVEPFNEVKYKALMDGLECSEINKSELEFSGRIDTEYYQKIFLDYQKAVKKCSHQELSRIASFLIGPFGSSYDTSTYVEKSQYRYIRGQDVKPFLLQDFSPRYMTEMDFNRLKKYALSENDILISVVGTLGNACIIQKDELPAIFSYKSTAIKTSGCDPFYLLCYLNSKYGKSLLLRKERGAIQKGLNLDDLKTLIVPLFSENFEQRVRIGIEKAFKCACDAKQGYTGAEKILEEMIGFARCEATINYSIKTLNKSYGCSGRLDAEYYQPKYDDLFNELEKLPCKKLGDVVTIKKSIEPGTEAYQDSGIPFVRVSDVSKFEVGQPEIYLSKNVVENVETLYPQKDTILFSKDGSVGIAYKLAENKKIITSGALLHLTVKDKRTVLPDYLTLVLNSNIVQMQAERDSNGAIIQHWKPSEIENVVVPVLEMEQQKKIVELVQKSFALRKQSKQLLEDAKCAVEMAIEQGEDIALKWLESKMMPEEV